MLEIKTKINIDCPPEKVWKILTDFEKYPDWNPMIKSIEGELRRRNRLKVRLEIKGMSKMTIKPRVATFHSGKSFSWLGHLLIIGLFDSHHIFELDQNQDGSTEFIHREQFSGMMVFLMKKTLKTKVTSAFEDMNRILKSTCEGAII